MMLWGKNRYYFKSSRGNHFSSRCMEPQWATINQSDYHQETRLVAVLFLHCLDHCHAKVDIGDTVIAFLIHLLQPKAKPKSPRKTWFTSDHKRINFHMCKVDFEARFAHPVFLPRPWHWHHFDLKYRGIRYICKRPPSQTDKMPFILHPSPR